MAQRDYRSTYPLITTLAAPPPSYQRAHRSHRSHLAGRPCEHCGATGKIHTALRPTTPPERLLICTRLGLLYSLDPTDYAPLCASCHLRQDRPQGKHAYCPRHPGGARYRSNCYPCSLERATARSARLWADPVQREKLRAQYKAYSSTPEYKARHAAKERARRAAARAARGES